MFPSKNRIAWYAVEVKPRFEKHAASLLTAKGFETYLPTYSPERQWKNRKAKLSLALFPGYLFCRFDPTDRLPILKTPGVYGVVNYSKELAEVDERELEFVRRLIAASRDVRPCEYLKTGERVVIEEGPLQGLEGIVVGFNKEYRIAVSVTILQRSVSAEIDARWIRGRTFNAGLTMDTAHGY
jgi:transcriptional antiterminator NusG